jgi:hypothetical protein
VRLVGFVGCIERIAAVGGVQLERQFMHLRCPARLPRLPQTAAIEDRFDHIRLRRCYERHDLYLAATLRATHRVHFINALDQHRPRLAVAMQCGLFAAVSAGASADATAAAFFRRPRDLFEYQP